MQECDTTFQQECQKMERCKISLFENNTIAGECVVV